MMKTCRMTSRTRKNTSRFPLVLEFARAHLPDHFDEVRDIFSGRGAYKRFRALLARTGMIDRWHDFESKATEQALREWCRRHAIDVVG
jgi:hypothetical protein